jgi:curli biogenesis system outer membrane secretion channel CsgG
MKRAFPLAALVVTAAALLAPARPATAQDAPKRRVAIMGFEFGTVQRWWDGNWDVGTGISDLVVTGLVKDGSVSVIERKMLDTILAEQNFNNSERANPQTAAKIGKVLGVNAIITGSVTQFGFEDKNFNAGAVGGVIGKGFGLGGFGKKKSKAIVVVDARIIDVTTGEILAVATGKGESRRDSFSGFGGGGGGRGFGAANLDMGSSNFQQTIVGEATRKCVEALCAEILKGTGKVEATKITLAGRVADADNGTLILNIGKDNGVKVGDVLNVERVVREVKDPDTGKVLREVTEIVGTVKITQVDEKSAVGTFTGSGAPRVGDRVKSK